MGESHNRILITAGDPGGIGYEVVLKALPALRDRGVLDSVTLIASRSALKFYDQILKTGALFEKAEILSVGPEDFIPEVEKDHAANGRVAMDSINLALSLIREKKSLKLVTGPISKKAAVLAGYSGFTGHTSYLAEAFGVEKYTMTLANPRFAVSLVTVHCPLSEVPVKATESALRMAVENTAELARRSGHQDQPLFVCALNPHAGEDGELGHEERDWVIPALAKLKQEGYPVKGPYPADSLFKKAYTGEGRYFIAMYHDQGLIPVKMLGGNETVNLTLGLPFFRISVEHGTAYDIAGKNQADISSFLAAFDIAWHFEIN